MKISIAKLTATGEQLNIEFNVPSDRGRYNTEQLGGSLETAFGVIDARLREMNRRILEANRISQGLTPEQNMVIRQVLDTIHGGPMAAAESPDPEMVIKAKEKVTEEAAKLGVEDPFAEAQAV